MQARIMIVDGSGLTREVLARALSDALDNVEVTACASASEALTRLREQRFDLVSTSLLLNDMDGLAFCREIRATKHNHYTPIVVISGDTDERLVHEGFAAGVTDYFDKSLGYRAFGNFIRAFFERHTRLVGRVLYVEDSPTSALATRRILERHGLEVVHTTSAEEALKLLRSKAHDFDMVITDFYLKDAMTGGDLLYALRAHHPYSQQELPVLVITGNDEVKQQVSVFRAGANDFVNKPLIEEVLMARVIALLLIKHQYDILRDQARTLEHMASTDSLTGVRNKRYLLEQGPIFCAASENGPLWVMIVDLDHFKQINDNLGHITGDQVLAAIGKLLSRSFPQAMVSRFGGEEFAIFLPNCERNEALAHAERLRRETEALCPEGVPITVSIGLACADEHPGLQFKELFALADKALYSAKESGRNRICVIGADNNVVSFQEGRGT